MDGSKRIAGPGNEADQEEFDEDDEEEETPKEDKSKDDDPMKNYEFNGETYIYTDKTSNVTYRFDRAKNEWIVRDKDEPKSAGDTEAGGPAAAANEPVYGFENDTHTYTDPSDGSVYMWDKDRSAWFPKVDDDFMARYQMSYGFVDPNQGDDSKKPPEVTRASVKLDKEQKKAEAKRKAAEPASWFEIDEAHNTAIYISGLPLDITMDELAELVTKCGLLARDERNKNKIKLYRDANGEPKGDALCTYIKVESVDLALKVLDGSQLRGKTLSIQRAKFQMKGQYDPGLKPKKKKNYKERQKKIQEKLFDWRPEPMRGEPLKCERVVIIKNLFNPEDFDKEVALILEYQQDLRSECTKCGDVKKVVIYDRHPEGVAQVTFSDPAEAQACIQLLNGRWFAQRQLSAEIWDGKTKYKVAETDAEIEARLDKWDKFLEGEDEKKEAAALKKETEEVTNPATGTAPSDVRPLLNVHQRSLETAGLEICAAGGSVPQGQPSSAGSVGSAPSPASPRPTPPQPRQPLATATTTSQPSRTLDDDRSTDAVGPAGATADDSDDGESRAQYINANCVVFTHYRGDAASEVEEHFQRALAHDKLKENISPMSMRNFPPSFWNSQHPGDVYEYPTDPWHPHYPQYHHRAVHEYHHHNMAAASYGGLLLGGARGLGHHTSHHAAAHHAHAAAASYKDWTSATPSQSLVDASSAPPYPHGPYAPLSGLDPQVQDSKDLYWF